MKGAATTALWAILRQTGGVCVKVAAMSVEERRRQAKPGSTPPIEGGILCALMFQQAALELIHRGELPKGWLNDGQQTAGAVG